MSKTPSSGATHLARLAGTVCLSCALAGCGSGKSTPSASVKSTTSSSTSTSTSTTAPKPVTVAAVRAFFSTHDGKTLLAFDRATAVLATGSVPKAAQCLQLTTTTLPKIVHDPNSLNPIASKIPDPALANAFSQDVRIKVLLLLGCSENAKRGIEPATDPASKASWTTVHDFAAGLQRLLARYGITA
jgi:hypothetical protein